MDSYRPDSAGLEFLTMPDRHGSYGGGASYATRSGGGASYATADKGVQGDADGGQHGLSIGSAFPYDDDVLDGVPHRGYDDAALDGVPGVLLDIDEGEFAYSPSVEYTPSASRSETP